MTIREIQAPGRAKSIARSFYDIAYRLVLGASDKAGAVVDALDMLRAVLEEEAAGRLVAQAQLEEAREEIRLLREQIDRDRVALLTASVRGAA